MWLLMDLIPDRFYVIIMEFFVAESQKLLLVKRLLAAARSQEKYRAKLQSNAWGVPWGRWAVLELTGILTPLSNKLHTVLI